MLAPFAVVLMCHLTMAPLPVVIQPEENKLTKEEEVLFERSFIPALWQSVDLRA